MRSEEIQALLDAEAALARAVAPPEAAAAIGAACRADGFELETLSVPALVRALTERVGGDAAGWVHRGATSQDIVDTAAMLLAQRARETLLAGLEACGDVCAGWAEEHRGTLMIGRTLLQDAQPITFGLKAANWLLALDAVRAQLAAVALPAQLGGAVGTLASLGEDGLDRLAAFAREAGLDAPVAPWHTNRVPIAALASALGAVAGVAGKVALDLVLLAQTAVGEALPAHGGGSSTMPHKANPADAIAALAAARRTPGLVGTLFACLPQEHERAAGAWQAEWDTLQLLIELTGVAVAALRAALVDLRPDPERMRANLERSGDAVLAEAAVTALADEQGRLAAHDRVSADLQAGRPLPVDVRAEDYLGATNTIIDRALAAHERGRP